MRTSGCPCGELRYESEGELLALNVWYCKECRRQSVSAFGISVIDPRESLHATRGAPKFWTRPADSGGRVKCAFCPNYGSRVRHDWHESEGGPETISIKGGSLDEAPSISAAIHIWTSRKLPGVDITNGVQQFPEESE